jgi:hypothetical protein
LSRGVVIAEIKIEDRGYFRLIRDRPESVKDRRSDHSRLRLVRWAGNGPKAFSHALLPMAGVAAAMKAGDDQEDIELNEEKERVGKFLRARPTESLKDGGELPRILNDAVDFGAEATA